MVEPALSVVALMHERLKVSLEQNASERVDALVVVPGRSVPLGVDVGAENKGKEYFEYSFWEED